MIKEKRALLVASFGTSHPDTCEKNITAIENAMACAFPDWEVRRAFTSGMIMKKLLKRDGVAVDSVEQALERLAVEGFHTAVLQPTHILNGLEFDDIAAVANRFSGRFPAFSLGAPLLTDATDFQALTGILGRMFPTERDTAVCLMGHGSAHFADCAYAALEYHLQDQGLGHIFVGTVEGFPDLATLMRHVAASGAKRVVLTPLMVVAGDHAKNDMAGDGADSWRSAFTLAGYEVECVLRGLGECREVRDLYAAHAGKAIEAASRA